MIEDFKELAPTIGVVNIECPCRVRHSIYFETTNNEELEKIKIFTITPEGTKVEVKKEKTIEDDYLDPL